jgi:predicted dehydrogenase
MHGEPLHVGVLGAGAIAQFAHLPALGRCRRARLAALCDAAPDRLRQVGDRFAVARRYSDYDAMLGDSDIEAIIIAAPDPFHVPLAIRALHAGKHVLVEKPMGETSAQCRELIDAQRRTGLKVQVGSMKRHDPGVAFAASFLRDKAGPILSISGVYRDTIFRPAMQRACLDPLIEDAHTVRPAADPKADRQHYNLTTQGAHLFDTLRYLAGDVAAVTARVVDQDGQWSWHGTLELAAGGLGHFELTCKACGDWCERYEVYGRDGSAQVQVSLPFYHRPAHAVCFDGATQTSRTSLGGASNAYANQIDAFADAIRHDLPTNPDARDGLAAVLLLEAVEHAARSGERVVVDQPTGATA